MNEHAFLSAASQTREAHARISEFVRCTPVLRSALLDQRVGRPVFLKLENTQRTGSFKVRGAFNKLLSHKHALTEAGVVAWSSGNHGIAVSEAARHIGAKATVIAPADAPSVKLDAIRQRGGSIISYDRRREDREAIAREFSSRTGALIVPAYDDPWIVAGQGVVAEELIEQVDKTGLEIGALLVPCGGGGLVAGCTTPFARKSADTKIYAVEPEYFDDTARSLVSGERTSNAKTIGSICDSLLTTTPGALTFPINRQRLSGAITVTDDETLAAIAFAYEEFRIVVEPGGAVALAAVLAGKIEPSQKAAAVIISGGNIDLPILTTALSRNYGPSASSQR